MNNEPLTQGQQGHPPVTSSFLVSLPQTPLTIPDNHPLTPLLTQLKEYGISSGALSNYLNAISPGGKFDANSEYQNFSGDKDYYSWILNEVRAELSESKRLFEHKEGFPYTYLINHTNKSLEMACRYYPGLFEDVEPTLTKDVLLDDFKCPKIDIPSDHPAKASIDALRNVGVSEESLTLILNKMFFGGFSDFYDKTDGEYSCSEKLKERFGELQKFVNLCGAKNYTAPELLTHLIYLADISGHTIFEQTFDQVEKFKAGGITGKMLGKVICGIIGDIRYETGSTKLLSAQGDVAIELAKRNVPVKEIAQIVLCATRFYPESILSGIPQAITIARELHQRELDHTHFYSSWNRENWYFLTDKTVQQSFASMKEVGFSNAQMAEVSTMMQQTTFHEAVNAASKFNVVDREAD